ncbi:MAG: DUF1015 family protein [Rubricoccaceae bacterium]|nr:DUF1015 family protein [Rubricoccaceae bacterium]
MATVRPFCALRPHPDFVQEVASVPYDVINSAEARELAEGKPHSFLRVIRPEVDLPNDVDEHDEQVYGRGAENLASFAQSEAFLEEEEPSLYVYRLVMNGRTQTGIYGLVSVEEYNNGVILKHEKTRPDKEDDRTRHILEQSAHAEPVMLAYRGTDEIDRAVVATTETAPLYDFQASDYVRHTIWKVDDSDAVSKAFSDVSQLYVADGHHRCAAAGRAASELPDNEEAQYFMAVLFPTEDMEILPYNRVVKKLPVGKGRFLDQLEHRFEVEETYFAEPEEPGIIGVYLGDGWYRLRLPETEQEGVAATLDVARLGEHLLEPMLGITDPRTDQNIAFVGGIRGTSELERLVDSGEADLAISMYPTSPEELLDVSDAGELMPPKSTWFEPKLRSGLLVHRF